MIAGLFNWQVKLADLKFRTFKSLTDHNTTNVAIDQTHFI